MTTNYTYQHRLGNFIILKSLIKLQHTRKEKGTNKDTTNTNKRKKNIQSQEPQNNQIGN
jgi:hypothetical protein